mmetsp:Transcript_20799/g.52881  ORF Transcript_20799/g.52881 Transcript_20799/m.52881 type:complete len:599 (+) Transcript_20799:115-1911(+)
MYRYVQLASAVYSCLQLGEAGRGPQGLELPKALEAPADVGHVIPGDGELACGQVAAQAHRARDQVLLALVQLTGSDLGAQGGQGDVERAWHRAVGHLGGLAHVQHHGGRAGRAQRGQVQVLPVRHLHVATHHVGRHHARQVDHVLGAAVLRRVAQLRLLQVEHRTAHLHGHRHHIHPLLHTLRLAHRLAAQNLAGVGAEDELEVNGGCTWVVPRVVVGVRVHLLVLDARALERLLAPAGGRHGHAEHAHHRGALHAAELELLAAHDDVGRNAALPVGGASQGHQRLLPSDPVLDLHSVAHCQDVGVAGAHAVVHSDTSARAQRQASRLGQPRLWPHTDHQHHHVPGVRLASRSLDQQALAPRALLKAGHPVTQVQLHALPLEVGVHQRSHLNVQGSHDLRPSLHQGHCDTPVSQVLRHLETDEAAAHHHGALDARGLDVLAHSTRVRDGLHGKDTGQVHTRQGGLDGSRARGQHQLVVAVSLLLACLEVLGHHRLGLTVDGDDLSALTHLDVEPVVELGWRGHQQLGLLSNDAGHMVRKAAVGKGHILPALKDRDVCSLRQAAQARCAGCASRHTTDDQDLLGSVLAGHRADHVDTPC